MTETYVTTAEQELQSIIDWLEPMKSCQDIRKEVQCRLARVQGGVDGWRYRCQIAEKKNQELINELRWVREQLMDLQNPVA